MATAIKIENNCRLEKGSTRCPISQFLSAFGSSFHYSSFSGEHYSKYHDFKQFL